MSAPTALTLSLCNELLAQDGLSLDAQCEVAKALGYEGLELSPGTLAPEPHTLGADTLDTMRQTVERHGLRITGLHWLLAPYPAASIFDPSQWDKTKAILFALIDQCARLGGSVLVHGSPSSRHLPDGVSMVDALSISAEFFRSIAARAEERGVTYAIEPLSRAETAFINTVDEAALLVEMVGSPAFKTMIDTSAAGQTERVPVAELIRRWVPTGMISHIQVNDTNRGAPGTGDDPFHAIVAALDDVGWDKPVAVEPFKTVVNGVATAAIGAATLRAHFAACAASRAR
ncbi:MAG: sugar phosphate isomerase/epimerase family protein [Pseudomonadota bacterium]